MVKKIGLASLAALLLAAPAPVTKPAVSEPQPQPDLAELAAAPQPPDPETHPWNSTESLVARSLIFYPPGQAPSDELEYRPIPFTDLLPPDSIGNAEPMGQEDSTP